MDKRVTLLSELSQFVAELEHKEATAIYIVPNEVMKAVKKAKSSEKLLHGIFTQVTGNGGIELSSTIRREFGMNEQLMDHFKQWATHSKEQFEDELHEAIERAEIRAGNQGIFFEGTPSKLEAVEALQLLKDIAHATVRCQFHVKLAEPELYVDILGKLLRFYELPNTYPMGNAVNFRNLISADRLSKMAGDDDEISDALMKFAKKWYQQSAHNFLESMEGYLSYEYVQYFLYALTEEQIVRLQSNYVQFIKEEFKLVKAKPDLNRAKFLLVMLEVTSAWPRMNSQITP